MKHSFAPTAAAIVAIATTLASAFAGVKPTVNIVNFVRGVEPRNPSLDLVEPLRQEIALNTKHSLPNTILMQYDAMQRDDIMAVARGAQRDLTEYGVWFEVVQALSEKAGIKWRGRTGYSWDWYVNPGFLMAYAPKERERLVDELFALFREKFGEYPKSVGSWLLDAHSMDYMQRKYGVKGFCICREQDNVDAYSLRGGYFNGAYYPSRRNMLSAAVDMANAIKAPVFRLLTPDPIYNYAGSIKPTSAVVCPTLEPVWPGGGKHEIVDWYFRVYGGPGLLNLSYMQIGQENSFGWPRISKGLPYQIEKVVEARAAGRVVVERFCDTAERFMREHPANCPQTQVALEDWCGQAKSVWYNSRHYRANLLWHDGALRIRDIHKMCDDYEESYLDGVCRGMKAEYLTPAVVDGLFGRWDTALAPVEFKGKISGLEVETPDADTLRVTAAREGGGTIVVTFTEGKISVAGDALEKFVGGKYCFFGCEFEVPVVRRGDTIEIDLSK